MAETDRGSVERFCQRHYRLLAGLLLAIAAFNLSFRLDREIVTEWDESLYATTAWEALNAGHWIGTTFQGAVDYYNSKPPLNVWLLAASMKLFGENMVAIRLPSVVAAWLTMATLLWWSRQMFGELTALFATLVLSTSFGFLYVHSGRSANPDALLALLILLTAVTLWAALREPRWIVATGALLSAVFLLKGMAALMPLAIVMIVLTVRWQSYAQAGLRARHLALATILFLSPIFTWAILRWRFDGRAFFDALLTNDLVLVVTSPIDGHDGSLAYYLHVVQKDHYEWLVAALVMILVARRAIPWRAVTAPVHRDVVVVLASWALVTFVVPTVMATKLPWYVNPFLPALALAIGVAIAAAIHAGGARPGWRAVVLSAVVVVAFGVAETKLLWYSRTRRDMTGTLQGVLLADKKAFAQRKIFAEQWNRADRFVADALVKAHPRHVERVDEFMEHADSGDYLIVTADGHSPRGAVPAHRHERFAIYRHP